ncbi:MAG: MmcQ/YjbR family DNA-binding protein [Bryobacteraceae bacterium]|jgi:predicted DNA-binding protein (MmcQ/YjbR family)
MDIEWVRRHCLSFPHATERVQWGDNLVFKVAGKIFAILALEPGGQFLCFKGTPEESAELVERPGIIPAPYLARAHWVALESEDALSAAEIKRLLGRSYDLVVAKLPKAKQTELRKRK